MSPEDKLAKEFSQLRKDNSAMHSALISIASQPDDEAAADNMRHIAMRVLDKLEK